MDSSVEVVAAFRRGITVLTCLRATGLLALRQTGSGAVARVHLVAAGAGPLGGDRVRVALRVGAGAHLVVRSVGATVVLPGPVEAHSRSEWDVQVGQGGAVDIRCEPTIVVARASHTALTRVRSCAGARVSLHERVLLGRCAEPAGVWTGRTSVEVDGRPVLRHTLRSDLLLRDGHRAVVTQVGLGLPRPWSEGVSRFLGDGPAARLPLSGEGTLLTATGQDLTAAEAHALRLDAPDAGHQGRPGEGRRRQDPPGHLE